MSVRVGLGFDVHPFGGDRALVLGGVELEGRGLQGHSDADVVTHAIADALLGAAGLDDLGTRYPASDEAWRDAVSVELLGAVARDVAGRGYTLGNVDVVVAAERPALASVIPEMERRLLGALAPLHARARALRLKAKRTEGLGAIGRAEGIAAWAVALLEA